MDGQSRASAGHDHRGGSRRRWTTVAVAAAIVGIAASAAIVVGSNLADKQTEWAPTEALGTVTKIKGSTITVSSSGVTTRPSGHAITVVTSSSTRFIVHAAGALSDVRSGDNVLVMGATTGSVVAAQAIIDGGTTFEDNQRGLRGAAPPPEVAAGSPPDANRPKGTPPVAGIVNGVDGSSFTLSKPDGTTVTVNALASTVTVLKASALDGLRVGDVIRVVGMSASPDTIAATSVRSRAG